MSWTGGRPSDGADHRRIEFVPEPVAKQAIADALAPLVYDMEFVKPWMWVRPLSSEHRAVLTIAGYQGATFELEYGVCCTWVPHTQGKAWRWHRTVKQTRRDLFVSHLLKDSPPAPKISHLHGLEVVLADAVVARDIVGPRALSWWRSVDTPSGVLAEALRQVGLDSPGISHYPYPGVVAAFTMAKLGAAEAAEQQLRSVAWLTEAELSAALQRLAELG